MSRASKATNRKKSRSASQKASRGKSRAKSQVKSQTKSQAKSRGADTRAETRYQSQDAMRRAEQREDSIFGSIAIEQGLISREELDATLEQQRRLSESGDGVRLGTLLQREGKLTTEQFLAVLNQQNRTILTCPSCAAQFNIKGREPGKRMRCKHCKEILTIPTAIDTQSINDSLIANEALSAPSVAPETGAQTFGKYTVEGEIARGGMGIVFRATQFGVGRPVALKVLKRDKVGSDEAIQRFFREAQLAGRLNHPNIVPVYEVGEVEGEPFMAMALVEGCSLDEALKDGKVTKSRALVLMEEICRAMHHAHGEGIVHRDLKPGNVLLDEDMRPMLTDFGLAKHLDGQSLTQSGIDIGTPHYMSPEQVLGKNDEVDERSDVYALGVMLYQLMTRKLPFGGKSAFEIYHKILNDTAIPPSKIKRGLSRDLDAVCAKAMAPERDERYRSAKALAEDIKRLRLNRPVSARKPSKLDGLRDWIADNTVAAAAVGLVLLVGLAAAGMVALNRETGPKVVDRPDDGSGSAVAAGSGSQLAPGSGSEIANLDDGGDSGSADGGDDEAGIYLIQAKTALAKNQWAKVSALAKQALAVDPDSYEAHYLVGVAAFYEQDWAAAERACSKAIDLNPYYVDALFIRGYARFDMDKYDLADKDFTRLIGLPDDKLRAARRSQAYQIRGRTRFLQQKTQEALDDYRKAFEHNPRNYFAYHHAGIALFARVKQYDQSRAMFEQALKIRPNYVPSLIFRGACFAYLNEFDKAFDDFSAAYDLDPQWVHQFIEMGMQARNHDPKRYGFDIAEAKRFIDQFTARVQALALTGQVAGWKLPLYLGLYRHYVRDYKSAVSFLTTALKDAPDEYKRRIYVFRGQAHDMLGNNMEAVTDFSKALETQPDDKYALLHRAVSYLKLDNLDDARTDLLAVLTNDPNEVRAQLHLGMIDGLQDRWPAARKRFTRCQQIAPTDCRGFSLMAWALASAPRGAGRDLEAALGQAQAGIKLNTRSALTWGIAGLVLEARGEKTQATRYLKKALAAGPIHWYFSRAYYQELLDR